MLRGKRVRYRIAPNRRLVQTDGMAFPTTRWSVLTQATVVTPPVKYFGLTAGAGKISGIFVIGFVVLLIIGTTRSNREPAAAV